MYYMVDNYDSFVYNLSAYFEEAGQEVLVRRADQVDLSEIYALKPEGIILSPGPKHPEDAAESIQVLQEFQNKIPILGVCLGHQVIGYTFGAKVCKGTRPMHGKLSAIRHNRTGLFFDLPASFEVTRYHSLVVSKEQIPSCCWINAWSEDGAIMAMSHCAMPIYGVQFHPEAVLTQYGRELLVNFHKICERWNLSYAAYSGI